MFWNINYIVYILGGHFKCYLLVSALLVKHSNITGKKTCTMYNFGHLRLLREHSSAYTEWVHQRIKWRKIAVVQKKGTAHLSIQTTFCEKQNETISKGSNLNLCILLVYLSVFPLDASFQNNIAQKLKTPLFLRNVLVHLYQAQLNSNSQRSESRHAKPQNAGANLTVPPSSMITWQHI